MSVNKYKEIFGIEKYVFDRLLNLLEIADTYQRKNNAGRKSQLNRYRWAYTNFSG